MFFNKRTIVMSTCSTYTPLYQIDRAEHLFGGSGMGWGVNVFSYLPRNTLKAMSLTSKLVHTAVQRHSKPNTMVDYMITEQFHDPPCWGGSYNGTMKMTITRDGYILICATDNDMIAILDASSMQLVRPYAKGLVCKPIDVVITLSGNIVVSNHGNLEILVFKSLEDPTIVARIKYGIAMYLTVCGNTLAVTDTTYGRIFLYETTEYTLVHTIQMRQMYYDSEPTHFAMNFPISITSIPAEFSPTGEPLLAVTDMYYVYIQIIAMDGTLAFVLKPTHSLWNPSFRTITHHNGEIFLTGYNATDFHVMSFNLLKQHVDEDATLDYDLELPPGCIILTEEHTILSGKRGTGPGELDLPAGIAVTSDMMWVADKGQLFKRKHTISSFRIM